MGGVRPELGGAAPPDAPRAENDVSEDERRTEAAWIARAIESRGGSVPPALVEDVLELHRAYLHSARPAVPPRGTLGPPPAYPTAPPGPPAGPPPAQPPGPPPQTGPPSAR